MGLQRIRLRALFDITIGRQASVIARLGGGAHPGIAESSRLHVVCMAEILCQRFARAEQLIVAHRRSLGTKARPHLGLEFLLLLGSRRLDEAEALLRREAADNHGQLDRRYLHGAISLALCRGRRAEARDLLARLDPRGEQLGLAMERTRLHLLDDELDGAARAFAPLLPAGPYSVVENQLAWAHEITAPMLARLWHAAQQVRAAPGKSPFAAAPAIVRETGPVLVGSSPLMTEVRRLIPILAAASQPVLISGETGTGKEIVAQLLHRDGPRAREPFIALNAAGLPEALAEAELFGHAKGAFTGAIGSGEGLVRSAGDGVLFIDEVNSMPLRLQGLLLRLLESGEYRPVGGATVQLARCRFLFASNVDLAAAVANGSFRQDLLFRLNRLGIDLPPLRERPEDIPALCAHFLGSIAPQESPVLEDGLVALFRAYPWPGNVRELRNEIERLVLLRAGRHSLGLADADVLSPPLRTALAPATAPRSGEVPASANAEAHFPGNPRAQERRQRIYALFERMPRVYREEVVRRIGCSPNTATADLLALVEAGLLKRVLTSGHLRTSYFIRNQTDTTAQAPSTSSFTAPD